MLMILIVAAIVSLILGLVKESVHIGRFNIAGSYEGLAILVAVAIVDVVTAYNNWKKEQEFKKLQEC